MQIASKPSLRQVGERALHLRRRPPLFFVLAPQAALPLRVIGSVQIAGTHTRSNNLRIPVAKVCRNQLVRRLPEAHSARQRSQPSVLRPRGESHKNKVTHTRL